MQKCPVCHENLVKIYYKDTDCYGIVWHGAYIKWFEIGRVELSHIAGIDFKELDNMQILLPVVELNCRYKTPARVMDEILVTTEIAELKKISVTFSHIITNNQTGNLILNATSTIVATKDGNLCRRLPDYLFEKYSLLVNSLVKS